MVGYETTRLTLFAGLPAPVAGALGGLTVAIEHVGSTAIRALAAKPILDTVRRVDRRRH